MMIMLNVTDIAAILFLIFMEGMLSLDNALALALVVRHLPKSQQRRALTYGIWGAFTFRFLSLFLIRLLLSANWVRLVGGGYLLYLALKYFLFHKAEEASEARRASIIGFWTTVVTVELLDITFSVDSILASVAVSQKFLVVFIGGALGIVMMRFASSLFVSAINTFPKLERLAYGIIAFVGSKLLYEWIRA